MRNVTKVLFRKILPLCVVIIMMITIVPSYKNQGIAAAATSASNIQSPYITLSNPLISMTEVRNIDVAINFGYSPNVANLKWTFGDKDFSMWQKWDSKAKDFKGNSFITLTNTPNVSGNEIKATIKFDLPFDTVDLSPRTIRVQYPKLIGTYNLQVKDLSTGIIASIPMKLNAYDDYHPYSEFKTTLDAIKANAKAGRYVEISSLGKSSGGNEMYFVIVAKDKSSVDNYLATVPQMYNDPASLQKKIQDKKNSDFKVPVWFNNVHPDEAMGSDAILRLAGDFATKDKISYRNRKALDAVNTPVITNLSVDKILDNEILLFNVTENPDGRISNRRANINGIDLNRDYGYQTQVESRNFAQAVNKWAPLSLIDFHGFYPEMVIEPCTGPHNPNYEYDLLMDGMIPQAYLMGKAAVANTKFLSFDIPYMDYLDSFDDATPCYTSTYAMFQGALSSTFEIPELNEEGFNAQVNGGYAAINYVSDNKIKLFNNQLEMYERQLNNEDNTSVDRYYTDSKGYEIGRPRVDNTNFFPEYYIIPIDKGLQKNIPEAEKMIEMLLINGVKVQKTTMGSTIEGKYYPQDSYVIPMHQAKRDFANVVLYKGFDASDWSIMYAEIVNDFPNLRGFDSYEVRSDNVLFGTLEDVNSVTHIGTTVDLNVKQYLVKNNSNEAVMAVNELLKSGKPVYMVTEASSTYSAGDYIVLSSDLNSIKDKYDLNITPVDSQPNVKELKNVKVYALKSSSASAEGQIMEQTGFVLRQLGFNVVDNINDADVVVDGVGNSYSGYDMKSYISSGKPYVGVGGNAVNFIDSNKIIDGLEIKVSDDYYEGAVNGVLDNNNILTNGYSQNEILYFSLGTYITKTPADAVVFERISDNDNFFRSGWWPNHDVLKGQIAGIKYKNIILFANDITNKSHPENEFRLLSNAIYSFQVNKP